MLIKQETENRMRVGNRLILSGGFTLIELLVTLAVASILITVAVPDFQRMMVVNRMTADYNEILAGLNLARSEAIKRREEVYFSIANDDGSGAWSFDVGVDGGVLIRSPSGSDGQTFISSDGTRIVFDSLGKRADCVDICSFTLDSASDYVEAHRLSVNILGRVSGGSS